MTIFLGSDHAGYFAKEEIKKILDNRNVIYEDMGTYDPDEKVDYPVFAKRVCEKVLESEDNKGILICGSGTGMQIAANKIKGIRASFAFDEYSAKMSRHDNDANVLTLRAREFDHSLYNTIVNSWLDANFSELERHKKRISMLE